jgi:hypothetical protein
VGSVWTAASMVHLYGLNDLSIIVSILFFVLHGAAISAQVVRTNQRTQVSELHLFLHARRCASALQLILRHSQVASLELKKNR